MTSLENLANYAEIVGACAVVLAIVFGVLEFRQIRHQRRENAALEMMRTWQGPEYVSAIHRILKVDDHIEPEALHALGDDYEHMAFTICMTFEALGLMAYRGTLPVEIVHQLMGGAVTASWRKLDRWVAHFRQEFNPRAFEWHEWLAGRLAAMPDPKIR
jgi:hypothetical protein